MPYRVEPPAAGGGGATNEDWVRADITDGTWTLNDPDTTLSGISNTAGLNTVVVDTTNNDQITDGGVHFKEILNPDGTSIDFSDSGISIEVYIHWPSQGWAVSSPSESGGLNRPGGASKCYTVAGVTTDPENFPSSAGATEWPLSILGLGIRSKTSTYKNHIMQVRNNGTSAPRGALEIANTDLNTVTADNYNVDGYKFMNRLSWRTTIRPFTPLNGSGMDADDQPLANEISVERLWDQGDRKTGTEERIVDQRFGRVRTNKLYFFISNGRGNGGAGSSCTIDFNCYYRIVATDAHPPGRTGLAT
tara:strand:- start:715 stop:1629 length:915 start_codon:yes stop_codon:yes gene_type:complete